MGHSDLPVRGLHMGVSAPDCCERDIKFETCRIALVVLFSDSLNAVWPVFTSDQWKVIGLAV
jgi:hypothetical protein